jgi:hypothetical protein
MKKALAAAVLAAFVMMGSAPAFAESGSGGGFFNDSYGFFKNLGKSSEKTETKEKKSTGSGKKRSGCYVK